MRKLCCSSAPLCKGSCQPERLTEGLTAGAKGLRNPVLAAQNNPSERHPPPTSPCTGEARSTKFSGAVSDGHPKKRALRIFFPLAFFHISPRIFHIGRRFHIFPELFHNGGKRWKTAEFPVRPGAVSPQGTVDGDFGDRRQTRRIFPKIFHPVSSFSPVSGRMLSNNRRA